jgi:hypothetical protein
MHLKRRHLVVLLAAAVGAAMLPSPAAAATSTQVASGLDSPRGITFVNGRMLVTESGHGSTNASDCFFGGPAAGVVCVGPSGRISWIDSGVRTTLVSGLFSQTARGGFDSEGPSGLSVGDEGRILAQISVPPQEVPAPPTLSAAAYALGQAQAGRLISVHRNGTWNTVAKVGEFDFNYTSGLPSSAHQEVDSNPTGVMATDDGAYVADSGANTLDRIGEEGKVTILFRDPTRFDTAGAFPADAVPSCVVRTAGGLLVGELSGRVLKVHGTSFTVLSNALFKHITGCTSDRQGNVYFVNMFGAGSPLTNPINPDFFVGSIVKYNVASGQATTLLSAPFLLPYGDTIGPDGNLYVTVRSICPTLPACQGATGGVIKITLPPTGENDN